MILNSSNPYYNSILGKIEQVCSVMQIMQIAYRYRLSHFFKMSHLKLQSEGVLAILNEIQRGWKLKL